MARAAGNWTRSRLVAGLRRLNTDHIALCKHALDPGPSLCTRNGCYRGCESPVSNRTGCKALQSRITRIDVPDTRVVRLLLGMRRRRLTFKWLIWSPVKSDDAAESREIPWLPGQTPIEALKRIPVEQRENRSTARRCSTSRKATRPAHIRRSQHDL